MSDHNTDYSWQWLGDLIDKYDDWQNCEEYHIHDGTNDHKGLTPLPHDFDDDKLKNAIQAKFEQKLEQRCREVQKELIAWAFQAESKLEPKFATEPLAVAHRLIERLKELDPDFAQRMEGPPQPPKDKEKE